MSTLNRSSRCSSKRFQLGLKPLTALEIERTKGKKNNKEESAHAKSHQVHFYSLG